MFKRLFIAILLGLFATQAYAASSIAYTNLKIGKTTAHVVYINLADPEVRVTVAMARGGTRSSESFNSMVTRTRPAAAITGTFFDTKTNIPTGDIALFGNVVHNGCIGSALCIDSRNRAAVVPLSVGRKQHWAGYETVLCAGPVLIKQGHVSIALRQEGFRNSLCAPTTRTAVGITHDGKLLMVAVKQKATLHQVAKLMIALGTRDALCLDGGSSTGFYAKGRYYASPVRRLTNLLVAYPSVKQYEAAKMALAPAVAFPKPVEHQVQPILPTPQLVASFNLSLLPPDTRTPQMPEWHQSLEH